jgi:hypothetical protein
MYLFIIPVPPVSVVAAFRATAFLLTSVRTAATRDGGLRVVIV